MDRSGELRIAIESLLRLGPSVRRSASRHVDHTAERAGRLGGRLLAHLTGLVSHLRRARMFHPDGMVYLARIEGVGDGGLQELGERLAGPALVRLSSAWWRGGKEWPDVLGVAVRFVRSDSPLSALPEPGDQDLLFATVRFPWTTLLAPLATNVRSFLWNHYHAVSPFEIDDVGRVKFRLRSPRISSEPGCPRGEHLSRAALSGKATFVLEARRLAVPALRRRWERVAEVSLETSVDIDQQALHFSPFRDGRGVRPVGFVHNLRRSTYAASQDARDRASGRAAAASAE